MSLTDIAIKNLKAAKGTRLEVWDDKVAGLGVRVSSSGTKSFVLLYRHQGRPRRMTLGRYPNVNLQSARVLANEALRNLAGGHDPQSEKVAAKSFPGFGDVVEDFIKLHCQRVNRDRTAKETERLLRKHFVDVWSERDIREIQKSDILKILDALVLNETPGTANHAFAAVRVLFGWCLSRGIVGLNPCAGLSLPSPILSRDRVLTDQELAAVLAAAERAGYPYGPIVKLLILTAQRRSEVGAMQWAEVDSSASVWLMPPARTKNGRQHQVALSPMARDIILSLPRSNSSFVFPARGNEDNPFSGFSKLKRRLDDDSGVTQWTLHDLRRTTATGLAGLGVPPHVVEKILNHATGTLGGVAGIYNRFQYQPEMREALAKWETHVKALVIANAPQR
jgi:integrase